MSKHCADCKYHQCRNHCFVNDKHCDGFCTKHEIPKKCYRPKCEDYIVDDYFKWYGSE